MSPETAVQPAPDPTLDSLQQLPPLGEFVPGAEVVEALEQGLRPAEGGDLEAEAPPSE